MIAQVVLAGVVPSEGEGFIQKFDLSTGISISASHKEFSGSGCCSLAMLPSKMDLSTGMLVALNNSKAALNYYAVNKERPLHRFFGQDKLCSVAVTPCGAYAVAGNEDGKLYVWDISNGELMVNLDAHYQRISVLRISADGTLLASGSADGVAKVWSIPSLLQGRTSTLYTLSEQADAVTDVRFGFGIDSNCRLLVSSRDGAVRLFDMVDGFQLAKFILPQPVTCALMSTTETCIYCGCEDGVIYILDLASNDGEVGRAQAITFQVEESKLLLKSHRAALSTMIFSMEEDLLISGDATGEIIIWNVNNRQSVRRMKTEGRVSCLTVISKGSLDGDTPKMIISPPKRIASAEKPIMQVIRAMPADTPQMSLQATKTNDDLRSSYSKLVDSVFSKLSNQISK